MRFKVAKETKRKKSTKTTRAKKTLQKNKLYHRLDEHLVAAVLVVAGIAILIILAGVISSTGQASYSGLPDSVGIINMLNQNTQVIDGTGRMKCTFACGKVEKQAYAGYFDQIQTETEEIKEGNYACSCIGIN